MCSRLMDRFRVAGRIIKSSKKIEQNVESGVREVKERHQFPPFWLSLSLFPCCINCKTKRSVLVYLLLAGELKEAAMYKSCRENTTEVGVLESPLLCHYCMQLTWPSCVRYEWFFPSQLNDVFFYTSSPWLFSSQFSNNSSSSSSPQSSSSPLLFHFF